jgi:hypothetical protein
MNCCKFGFKEHYPRPSHSWLFTLLFTCSEDVLVLHLCKKPLIGGMNRPGFAGGHLV